MHACATTMSSSPPPSLREGLGVRDRAVYPLKDRGLRVVTGRNEDEPLFESNGAGKSALVTAALWCLTGRATPAGEVGPLLTMSPSRLWGGTMTHVCCAHALWACVDRLPMQLPGFGVHLLVHLCCAHAV